MSRRAARPDAPDAEIAQLAAVDVAGERYAIDIMRIKGIVRPPRVTAVPGAPDFVEGVVEMRGALVPVVDLRRRFGKPPTEATRATKLVLVGVDGHVLGLVVDGVAEVMRVARSAIRPAPPLATRSRARARFAGALTRGERLVLVIDLGALLTDDERADLAALDAPDDGGADA